MHFQYQENAIPNFLLSSPLPLMSIPSWLISAPISLHILHLLSLKKSNVVNWIFLVDSGFLYLFRLYFCEISIEIYGGNERVFSVDIANITAERHVDVYLMAGGSKIPIFRDYLLTVQEMDGRRSKQNVSFAIRPNMETRPVYASALLNGLEIFKLNDTQGSMAASNPERLQISVNQAPPSKSTTNKGRLTRRLTTKSDVYAFGVVLFEVLSGRPALDMRLVEEQHSLATWAVECIRKGEIDQIFDRCPVAQLSPACSKVVVEIAGRCLLRDPRERPEMADVVKNLELALGMQQKSELALNVSGNCSDINPTSKGWSYLVRSHLYKLCQRGKFVVSKQ